MRMHENRVLCNSTYQNFEIDSSSFILFEVPSKVISSIGLSNWYGLRIILELKLKHFLFKELSRYADCPHFEIKSNLDLSTSSTNSDYFVRKLEYISFETSVLQSVIQSALHSLQTNLEVNLCTEICLILPSYVM
jgi:hypothetical protein